MLLLMLATALSAQNPNPLVPDCNWILEVCESPQPPGGCTDGAAACSPVYYYFYLARNGGQIGTNWTFKFKHFNFAGQLNITSTAAAGGTAKKLSTLNLAQSLFCSPPELNQPLDPSSPILGVDADGNFAYEVTNSLETDITWTFTTKKLLFVLAIDAYPGEIVTPANFTWSFSLPNGTVCAMSPVTTCNPLGLSGKSVSIPPLCASPLLIRFGTATNPNTPGYPNRKKIPVFISSDAAQATQYNIAELDFLLKINPLQAMAGVSVEAGVMPLSAVNLYKEPPLNSDLNQRVYANHANFSVITQNTNTADVGNTLFYILLDGPELESDCGTVTLAFTNFRRMMLANAVSCCQPRIGSQTSEITWAPSPCPGDCPKANVYIKPAETNLPINMTCSDLLTDIFIATVPTVTYDAASISLIVEHSGALSLNFANSFSTYCSSIATCITSTAISADLLRVNFSIDGATDIDILSTQTAHLLRLAFTGTDACIKSIRFSDALFHVKDATGDCLPATNSYLLPNSNSDDLCNVKGLNFKYNAYTGAEMEAVYYVTSFDGGPSTCTQSGLASSKGSHSICPCLDADHDQILKPSKDDNYLNGVTTYDLVLISKHILGIEPFSQSNPTYGPYRMIAADANKSNSVTTFDIVELRKLILGIYLDLPFNDSYRFLPKSYVFPNPGNPFSGVLPNSVNFRTPPTNAIVEVYGIKIGDVNETAQYRPAPDASIKTQSMGFGSVGGAKGAVVDVPVFAREAIQTLAWQTSLRYNPGQMKLLGLEWARPPEEFQDHDWFEPAPGEVNVLWYDGAGVARQVQKGVPLFYLKFELLSDVAAVSLNLSRQAEQNISYSEGGNESTLSLEAAPLSECRQIQDFEPKPMSPVWDAAIYPNPSSGQYRFEVNTPEAGKGRIAVCDVYGRVFWSQEMALTSGYNSINSSQMPSLSAGQYFIRFETAYGRKTIRFVKL